MYLFILPSVLFCQAKFTVDFDYAHFYSGNEFSTVEFYYSFSKNSLTQIDSDSKTQVAGRLKLMILDSSATNELVNKDWSFQSYLEPTEMSADQKLTGVLRYYLTPGEYICILKGVDAYKPSIYDSVSFVLKVPKFSEDELLISDLQLANSIVQNSQDPDSPFYKNTLEVVPNPSLLFGHGLPVLFFYYEMYNVDVNVKTEYLKVSYELIHSSGNAVYDKTKFISRRNNSVVDIGTIKVNKMMTGQYNFLITIEDSISGDIATSMKKIFIYNPDQLDTSSVILSDANFLSSKYLTMSEDELDEEFSKSKYIASMIEKNEWAKLTEVDAKRKFLFDFWNIRDANPATPINETQIEYLARIKEATNKYSNISQKEGWKTDRGRVYAIWGAPTEIERYPYDSETVPYEIWHYEQIEGGVVFVFADYSGFSSYKLLHSTKRGELYDSDWSQKIYK